MIGNVGGRVPGASIAGSNSDHIPVSHLQPAPHPLLAFGAGLLFSSRTIFALLTGRWLNIGTEPGVITGFVIAAALGLIAAFCAFGPRVDSGHSLLGSRLMRWIMLYLAFSGCSLFWTASASVTSSALYWLSLVGDVTIVALLVRSAGSDNAVNSLLRGFIVASCALAVIAWLMPAAEDLRLGDLAYFNTNQIGNLCALSVLMCSLLSARGNAVSRIIPWFLVITLVRSLSKATLAAFIACLLYRLIRDGGIRRSKKWLLSLAGFFLVLTFLGLFGDYYNVYTTAGNQAETLTGRTAIWIWTFDAALKHPLIGNGFDAMWKVAPTFGGELFEARHAENELLQQFFAYGTCGVVMIVGIYGGLFRLIRALPRGSERVALTAFLIYVGIRGLAEAEPFDLLLPLWLVAAFAFLLWKAEQKQPAVNMEPAPSSSINVLTAC